MIFPLSFRLVSISVSLMFLSCPIIVWSATTPKPVIIAGVHGPIEYKASGSTEEPKLVDLGLPILSEGELSIPADGYMQVLFGDNYLVSIGPDSIVNVSDSAIELRQGLMEVAAIGIADARERKIAIRTPNGGVIPTDGLVRVSVVPGRGSETTPASNVETFVVIEGNALVSSEQKGTQYVSLDANEAVRSENGVLGSLFQPEKPEGFLPICAINPHCVSSKVSPVAVSTAAAAPGPIVVEQVIIPPASLSGLTGTPGPIPSTPPGPGPGPLPPPVIPAP